MRLRSLLVVTALLSGLLLLAHCGGQLGAAPDGRDAALPPARADAGKPDVAPPRPDPKTGEVVVIELGSVPAGVPVTFTIPDNALGFNLMAQRGGHRHAHRRRHDGDHP